MNNNTLNNNPFSSNNNNTFNSNNTNNTFNSNTNNNTLNNNPFNSSTNTFSTNNNTLNNNTLNNNPFNTTNSTNTNSNTFSTTNTNSNNTFSNFNNNLNTANTSLNNKIPFKSYDSVSDLLSNLDIIYNCYLPNSPTYKFNYVFYNMVEGPVSKPSHYSEEFWSFYYKNPKLFPVILNKDQIIKRKELQKDLIRKINQSKFYLIKKINDLKILKEKIKIKIKIIKEKYRRFSYNFIKNNLNEQLNIKEKDIIERLPYKIKEEEECCNFLSESIKRLKKLEKEVKEDLKRIEKKTIGIINLK